VLVEPVLVDRSLTYFFPISLPEADEIKSFDTTHICVGAGSCNQELASERIAKARVLAREFKAGDTPAGLLDFGSLCQSYFRAVFRAVFPSSETPRHAVGAGVLGTMERNAE
jgi:hypothetical protein